MQTADSIEAKVAEKTCDGMAENTPVKKKRGDAARIAPWKWKKGFCPNPGGRPKNDRAKEIAQEIFENNPEAIYKALGKALMKGNAYAFLQLADRAYGKLQEKLEVTGMEEVAAALEAARKRTKK